MSELSKPSEILRFLPDRSEIQEFEALQKEDIGGKNFTTIGKLNSVMYQTPITINLERFEPDVLVQRPAGSREHILRIKNLMIENGIMLGKLMSMTGYVDWENRPPSYTTRDENDRIWRERDENRQPWTLKVLAGQYRLLALHSIIEDQRRGLLPTVVVPTDWTVTIYPGKPSIRERSLLCVWDNIAEDSHDPLDLLDLVKHALPFKPQLIGQPTEANLKTSTAILKQAGFLRKTNAPVKKVRTSVAYLMELFYSATTATRRDLRTTPEQNYAWYYALKLKYDIKGTLLSYGNLGEAAYLQPNNTKFDILKSIVEERLRLTTRGNVLIKSFTKPHTVTEQDRQTQFVTITDMRNNTLREVRQRSSETTARNAQEAAMQHDRDVDRFISQQPDTSMHYFDPDESELPSMWRPETFFEEGIPTELNPSGVVPHLDIPADRDPMYPHERLSQEELYRRHALSIPRPEFNALSYDLRQRLWEDEFTGKTRDTETSIILFSRDPPMFNRANDDEINEELERYNLLGHDRAVESNKEAIARALELQLELHNYYKSEMIRQQDAVRKASQREAAVRHLMDIPEQEFELLETDDTADYLTAMTDQSGIAASIIDQIMNSEDPLLELDNINVDVQYTEEEVAMLKSRAALVQEKKLKQARDKEEQERQEYQRAQLQLAQSDTSSLFDQQLKVLRGETSYTPLMAAEKAEQRQREREKDPAYIEAQRIKNLELDKLREQRLKEQEMHADRYIRQINRKLLDKERELAWKKKHQIDRVNTPVTPSWGLNLRADKPLWITETLPKTGYVILDITSLVPPVTNTIVLRTMNLLKTAVKIDAKHQLSVERTYSINSLIKDVYATLIAHVRAGYDFLCRVGRSSSKGYGFLTLTPAKFDESMKKSNRDFIQLKNLHFKDDEPSCTAIIAPKGAKLWVWPKSPELVKATRQSLDLNSLPNQDAIEIEILDGQVLILNTDVLYLSCHSDTENLKVAVTLHERLTPMYRDETIHNLRHKLKLPLSRVLQDESRGEVSSVESEHADGSEDSEVQLIKVVKPTPKPPQRILTVEEQAAEDDVFAPPPTEPPQKRPRLDDTVGVTPTTTILSPIEVPKEAETTPASHATPNTVQVSQDPSIGGVITSPPIITQSAPARYLLAIEDQKTPTVIVNPVPQSIVSLPSMPTATVNPVLSASAYPSVEAEAAPQSEPVNIPAAEAHLPLDPKPTTRKSKVSKPNPPPVSRPTTRSRTTKKLE